jgi:hypothetical protein
MHAADAAKLTPGTKVTVPFGSGPHTGRVTATVVSVTQPKPWGRGMRPAGTSPEDLYAVVRVELKNGQLRSFGNSLVRMPR